MLKEAGLKLGLNSGMAGGSPSLSPLSYIMKAKLGRDWAAWADSESVIVSPLEGFCILWTELSLL